MKVSLNTGLMGMDEFERVATVALVAKEHMLFVGPPGRAKTLAVNRLCAHLDGVLFSTQLSKFSDDSALFGLPDMKLLRDTGEIVYPRRGFATAEYALLDEIYDASDVLLRTLLSALEERIVMRGGKPESVPLRTCFATANYVRQNEVVAAVNDRFALALVCPQLTERQREELYKSGQKFEDLTPAEKRITQQMLDEIYQHSVDVVIPKELIKALMKWAKDANLSPRRERKLAKLMRVHAALHGRDEVNEDDIDVCRFVLPLSPAAASGDDTTNNKKAIQQLKDNIKNIFNESTQITKIEEIMTEPAKGEGLHRLEDLVERLKALRTIDTCTPAVEKAQRDALKLITEEHQKLFNQLGVKL